MADYVSKYTGEQIDEAVGKALNGGTEAGADGFSPVANVQQTASGAVVTITDKDGTTTATITNGVDGQDGKDGVSPAVTASKSGNKTTLNITDANGTKTVEINDGTDGQDGKTPVKGTDYFDGQDGKTAYQYAQDGGYTGTETEFSAKLAVPFITPEAYGAKGDGATDDSAAIQAAIDAAGGGSVVYLSSKTYLIGTGLIVKSNYARFVCDGLIRYTGTDAAVAIKSYDTASGLSRAEVRINRLEAESGTAVRLDASEGKMKSTYVDVNYIYKSKIGIHLYADNEYYISYSVIKSKEIKATETGIHIENMGSGEGASFLNEAFYHLGKITGCTTGVKIINAGAHKFMSGSFEDLAADGMSLYLENSSDNMFRNFRWAENYGATRIKFVGDCHYNDIEGSRMTLSEIDITELGSISGYNILRAPFIMNQKYGYRCGNIAYVDSRQGITYVPNYDDNSYVALTSETVFDTEGVIGRIENRILTSIRCDSADIDGATYTLSEVYSGYGSAARGFPVSFEFGTTNGKIKLQDVNGDTILDNTDGKYAGKTMSAKWCGYNYHTKKNAWLVQEQGEVAATERFVRECLKSNNGDMVVQSNGGNTYKIVVKDNGLLTTIPSSSINQVPLSIDTDGSVYNGKGYVDGYRINSSGVNTAASNTLATGYIAATGGNTLLISEWDVMDYLTTDNAVAVYDENFANLGVFTAKGNGYGIFAAEFSEYGFSSVVETDGVLSWVVPADAGIAYIRFSAYRASGETLSVIVEKGDNADEHTPIVESVNGRTGAVQLTANDVGARPDDWMPTAADVGARPSDWMPTAEQIGARPDDWMPTASEVGARPESWTPSASEVGARPSTWMPSAADVGARPDTWMPTASDVGARANDWVPTAAEVGARSDTWMPSATDVGALAAASHTTKALKVTYEDGTSETVTLVVTK